MDPRSYGPQIFPSAPLVRKRLEAEIDKLPPVHGPAGPRDDRSTEREESDV